jgi:hypothetical protein
MATKKQAEDDAGAISGSEAADVRVATAQTQRQALRGPHLMGRLARARAKGPAVAPLLTLDGGTGKQVAEAIARRKRAERNRFYAQPEQFGLPTPPDDGVYHYCWRRVSLNGKNDVRNLNNIYYGQLAHEPVKMDMLPLEQQGPLSLMSFKDGDYAGFIGVEDLLLMRTDYEAWQEWEEFQQLQADDQIMVTHARFKQFYESQGMPAEFDVNSEFIEDDPLGG